MKLLIIEAADRSGKDTLIAGLMPYCQNLFITHFSTPEGETDEEKRRYQETSFRQEFGKAYYLLNSELIGEAKKGKMNLLVWNRAHLGEFVYGTLYRQTHPEEWVLNLEEDYEYHKNDNVYLLLLKGDPEFLASKDDGESFASSTEARRKEITNFESAFNASQIQKKTIIHVNDGDNYISKEQILQQVLEFLKS
jgi:thymidylate kinase